MDGAMLVDLSEEDLCNSHFKWKPMDAHGEKGF